MKLTRNAVWLFACRFGGDLLNLLLFLTISRTLGPAGIGVYSYGFAVASFVFVIASIGIEDFGLRQYARLDESQRGPFIAELLGAQCVMLVLALGGLAVYILLTRPNTATLSVIATLTFYQIATAVAGTLFIPAMARQRMVGPAFVDLICRGIAYLSAAAAIVIAHLSITIALLGFFVAGVTLLFLALRSAIAHGGTPHVVISRHTLARVGNAMWSFAAVELFAQLFARVGIITLTLKISENAAGVFSAGLKLIEVALMPLAIIGLATYPRLSQLFVHDTEAFRRFANQFVWLTFLIAGGVAWGAYFVVPQILVPVLGNKYAGTEPIIQAMCGLAIVQGVEGTLGRLMLVSDLQIARAAISGTSAVLGILLNGVLISALGLKGAVWAICLWYATVNVIYIVKLRRPLTSSALSKLFTTLILSLILSVCAAWAAASRLPFRWMPAAAFLICFATVLALAYGRLQYSGGSVAVRAR